MHSPVGKIECSKCHISYGRTPKTGSRVLSGGYRSLISHE